MTAARGHLNATNSLAICYRNGHGAQKNLEQEFRLYKIASDRGNVNATFNLALCYENGYGVEKDFEEAFRLLKIASGGCNLI